MQPIYFAHGYRKREAPFAAYFGSLLRNNNLLPSLDPPSDTVNSAKLERHLKFTKGLVAILAERETGVSPHILFEISMCIRSGQPVLVFLEDTLPDNIIPKSIPQRRFSSRSFVRETREHMHALEIMETYIGKDHVPRYDPAAEQRSCLLLGLKSLGKSFSSSLVKLVQERGYNVIKIPSGQINFPIYDIEKPRIRTANLAIVILEDRTPSTMYFLGLIRSNLIPTIFLSTNINYPTTSEIPKEYQRTFIDIEKEKISLNVINKQIELFEEDFIELDTAGEAEKYAQQLSVSSSTSGIYSKDIRTTIIKELNMGDKYSANQVGAQGPNSHAHDIIFHQSWDQRKNEFDLEKLSQELSALRQHLKSIATEVSQDTDIGILATAEVAAKNNDGAGVLAALSKVGSWVLENSTKIGVAVATSAIKVALKI